MARPRKFDRDTVLAKAMDVFWAKGYESTSMEDLVAAMGINRGSLYAAFGDKRRLHLASLEHFHANEITRMLAPLFAAGPKLPAIRRVFEQVAECGGVDGERHGCLIYNTAIELGSKDPEVKSRVAAGLKQVEEGFFQALDQARGAGELGAGRDPRALARHLTNALNGLRVMCLVFDDHEMRNDIVETSLSSLS